MICTIRILNEPARMSLLVVSATAAHFCFCDVICFSILCNIVKFSTIVTGFSSKSLKNDEFDYLISYQ